MTLDRTKGLARLHQANKSNPTRMSNSTNQEVSIKATTNIRRASTLRKEAIILPRATDHHLGACTTNRGPRPKATTPANKEDQALEKVSTNLQRDICKY